MEPGVTTLAVIGDVHHELGRLQAVMEYVAHVGVDGVLLVGDLGSHDVGLARRRTPDGDRRYLESVREVLAEAQKPGLPMAWVPGNHDLPDLDLPGNCDGSVVDVAGLRVGGIGGAGPARFGFSYEWDEAQIRARAELVCDVLLCHAPPFGTPLDLTFGREHVGSQAIRERAERHVGFLVCGHIHEAPGGHQVGRTLCLNAGGLGRPFGKNQVGFLIRGPNGDIVRHVDLGSGITRSWGAELR